MIKNLLLLPIVVLILFYPFVVYWGVDIIEPKYIGIIIFSIFLARYLVIRAKLNENARRFLPILIMVSISSGLVLFFNDGIFLLINPFLINLVLFSGFSYSLLKPPTVIENIARLQEPDLPIEGIQYCRNVTLVWCAFFILNGLISLWTVFYTSLESWTIYNGCISYLAMGALFGGEFIYRKWVVQKKIEQSLANKNQA